MPNRKTAHAQVAEPDVGSDAPSEGSQQPAEAPSGTYIPVHAFRKCLTASQSRPRPASPRTSYLSASAVPTPVSLSNAFYRPQKAFEGQQKPSLTASLALKKGIVAASEEHKKDCIMCPKPGTKTCSGCKQAKYCSRKCQAGDWHLHKQFCKTFAGADDTRARPSPDHRRFLFFPAYTNKPQLIWAKCEPLHAGNIDMVSLEHEDITAFMEKTGIRPSTDTCAFPTDNQPRTLCGFQHKLVFIMLRDSDEHRIRDAQHVNRSINGLAQPGIISPWTGPVLAFATDLECVSATAAAMLDMSPRYVRHLADYLFNWDQNACIPFPKRAGVPMLPAIKLSDLADPFNVAMGITQNTQPVKVPRREPFSGVGGNMHITLAFLVGLTWYMRQASPRAVMASMELYKNSEVYLANLLRLPRWRGLELRWLGNCVSPYVNEDGAWEAMFEQPTHLLGSAVVVHGKGAELHPLHLDALERYLDDAFEQKFFPTRDGFAAFWLRYTKECVSLGMMEAAKEPKSPYELEDEGGDDILGGCTEIVAGFMNDHPRQIWASIVRDLDV
ncbi:hypothetical protein B0T25DRAFT_343825 [Lasiosphaeria hispida]|uniref:MYND-type domain-containing protein n=1 Tax=Lasiosphaeria hispida TaxID=260671 RepID=A0AAJ0M865_9PEZI|nr:hypothetical protein B0T25DRAFT_343825 [Lasiosphaeria hispida]